MIHDRMSGSDNKEVLASTECFVVSPIGPQGSETRRRADNVLHHVVRPAAAAIDLVARRADDFDAPGSITSQIIQRLLAAKAVVVDLTDRNPNVYYELAIRDSFKLPVVLIAEDGTALASDIVGQRTIFFDSRDLASVAASIPRITQALRDAIANPAVASPVHAAAQLDALSAGDAEQQVVAELAQEVARLRRYVDDWRGPFDAEDIEDLGLGGSTDVTLWKGGVRTLWDLIRLSDTELLAIPDLNEAMVREIRKALHKRRLSLRVE